MGILKCAYILVVLSVSPFLSAQGQDSVIIKNLYDEALSSKIAYENLRYLSEQIGPRLSGSPQVPVL